MFLSIFRVHFRKFEVIGNTLFDCVTYSSLTSKVCPCVDVFEFLLGAFVVIGVQSDRDTGEKHGNQHNLVMER